MSNELQKIKETVKSQLSKTDELIASNEAIADTISQLDDTFATGFSKLGAGLQELCFSLDDGFSDVSYKLDLQNETLQAIKEILESPLDTQAKELRKRAEFAYLNDWIDEAEKDLLESEKKNYQDFIALHILGNIYYHHKKNHQKALEYFQKAAKYAAPQSKIDACKALLCAANVYKELAKPEDAYKSTRLAIDMLPEDTHNLYNHAAYAAMTNRIDEFIDYLRKAEIKNKNATCLIAADNDKRFANVKDEKEALKREIRDGQRKAVEHLRQQIVSLQKNFKSARKVAEEAGITDFTSLINDLAALDKKFYEIDRICDSNGYLDLLKAERMARNVYNEGVKAYEKNIKEWLRIKNSKLSEYIEESKLVKGKKYAGWGGFFAVVTAILVFIIINISSLGTPKKAGPAKILTFTSNGWIRLGNTKYTVEPGSSVQLMEITNDSICIRIRHDEGCLDKRKILKMAKVESGYFSDYSGTLSGGAVAFWLFSSSTIIGIISANGIKQTKLSNVRNKIKKENNLIAGLQDLLFPH